MRKDKNVAAVLAFLLGFIGGHRIYLEQRGKSVLFLLFASLCFWTGHFKLLIIPMVIALVSGFKLLVIDWHNFNNKYNRNE